MHMIRLITIINGESEYFVVKKGNYPVMTAPPVIAIIEWVELVAKLLDTIYNPTYRSSLD